MSKIVKWKPIAGQAEQAVKKLPKWKQGIKDFFGNPVREMPFKIKGDPFLKTKQGRLQDIHGPAAPEFRAAVEKHMLSKINPETRVEKSGPSFFGASHERLGDSLNRYMSKDKKHLGFADVVAAGQSQQMGMGSGAKYKDRATYQVTLDSFLKEYMAAGKKGRTSDPVAGSKVVQDILNKYPNRKDKIPFHPDYFKPGGEAWERYTPRERATINEAIKRRIIDLKKSGKGGGVKGGDMFGYVAQKDTRDRILARRLAQMFDKEYRLHSATQRSIPGSKARDFSNSADKYEPLARGVRHARNVGIFALPTAGAAYGGHKLLEDNK